MEISRKRVSKFDEIVNECSLNNKMFLMGLIMGLERKSSKR